MGGRGRQRDAQRNRSSATPSGWAGQTPTEHAAGPTVPNGVSCLHSPSLPVVCVGSMRSRFVSCSVDTCVFRAPCPVALADVVVSSTSLAIIELHAEVGVLRTRSDALEYAAAQGSRGTRLDERDGLRFRCDLIQCEGHTPSGSRGGRVVPLRRRIICDRHDSGLSPGKGWHSHERCSVTR